MKTRLWLSLLLIVAVLLAACANPNAPAGGAATGGEAAAPAPAAAAPGAGVSEFHPAWPWTPPPAGNFNTYHPDGYNLFIYQALMEPPFFMYKWVDASWIPVAGTEWSWKDDTTLEVKLIQGAVWSDGHPFTTEDVISSFNIERAPSCTACTGNQSGS